MTEDKKSVYISCNSEERYEFDSVLCDHVFSTILVLPEYYIVMCEELQKQISKDALVR